MEMGDGQQDAKLTSFYAPKMNQKFLIFKDVSNQWKLTNWIGNKKKC